MDFQKLISEEREKLTTKIEELRAQRLEIDEQIIAINNELKAIDAYESAKSGKPKATKPKATKGTRTRRGGVKDAVLELITAEGIHKSMILHGLGIASDDKAQVQGVSNALVALKKEGKIVSDETQRGTYKLP